MEITNIPIDKLNPATYNPRLDLKPEDKEYQDIKRSIIEFTLVEPLVINKDMTVIGGHQRLKVLKDLQYKEVPCIVVDLDKQKEKMLNIALNKISGDWDRVKIKDLILELDTGEYDITLTGWGQQEMEDLMTEFYIEEPKDDDIPELPKEPESKLGDLYQLGNHRILCGDATKKEDIEKLMNGEKADLVFTDPPYNIGFSYNQHKDKLKYDDYKNFCKRFFELLDCSKIIITPGPRNLGIWYEIMNVKDIGWAKEIIEDDEFEKDKIYDEGIWYKKNARSGASCFRLRLCEPIIFYGKFSKKRNYDIFEYTRIIKRELTEARKDAGAVTVAPGKPVKFMVDIIKSFSDRESIVKDVFLGNGTTLIACEKTKRTCYGLELDPLYCDVIIKRWEEYTNKKAVILNG